MSALFGILSKKRADVCKQYVETMLSSMSYEDFYIKGTYSNPEMGIYLGWTCHPDSCYECPPVISNSKDIFIYFAGELYHNQQSDRSKQIKPGSDYQDAFILSYEKHGDNFPKDLNGHFCGLLLDTRCRKVFLFNDRYGMYRIFVNQNHEDFFFSSEAKAILSVSPDSRCFDREGLGELITCGCTLGNHSPFKGISIMSPGSLLTLNHGNIRNRVYFDPSEWTGLDKLEENDFVDNVVGLFGGIIPKYTVGRQPIGISLTGGLDSRMIISCLDDPPDKYPCYTFGSMYRDSLDVTIARDVAEICGHPFHVIVLNEDFLDNFENYMEKAVYISDGYIGMSGAAELYLNSQVRKIAPVRLTGNYGGELLRGTRAFKCNMPKGNFILPEFQQYLKKAQEEFHRMESTDAVTFALFRQAPSQGYGRLAIERSQITMRTPFMDCDLVKMTYQAPPALLKDNRLSLEIISRYKPELLKIPTDRGLLARDTRFRHSIRKLRHEMIIISEYLSSHGMPGWLAFISPYGPGQLLEKFFLGRNKFQHFNK
ncbi:MAG TPA: asparagine synthase-related protein, partial [Syntrophorhabdus sp.]|nr:asparagine synthase-related protein [Syntrophorhabdus sp.]